MQFYKFKLSNMIIHFRPKRLTLKGYKQYWFKFQDTSISYFKSKEESIGEPIQQINLKGDEYIIVCKVPAAKCRNSVFLTLLLLLLLLLMLSLLE